MGIAPRKVKITKILIYIQYNSFLFKLKWNEENLFFIVNENEAMIIIDIKRAITPPNLLGIERKIA